MRGNLISPTPSLAECSTEPPTSSGALGKSFRKPRGLGLPPKTSGDYQSPGIADQEIAVTGELAELQGPAYFNLVIALRAGMGKGGSSCQCPHRGIKILTDPHLVPTTTPEVVS